MGHTEPRKADDLFERLYTDVDPRVAQSLLDFRSKNPPKTLVTDGIPWEYLSVGDGDNAILFLHGMAGAFDIWWQQIEALRSRYRIISLTYPIVDNLEALRTGINSILHNHGIKHFNVVGTSLGGYLAQYLIARQPEQIRCAVFANTYPPNDLLARRTRGAQVLLRIAPNALIRLGMDINTRHSLFPASGRSELLKAYLLEGARAMQRELFLARYRCVIQYFDPRPPDGPAPSLLIIEAQNDPLISPELRQRLKQTYPMAQVHTFGDVGHFSYLHKPEAYTQVLERFISKNA
jgi:maspardin